MLKPVKVQEVEGEGLLSLLNKRVLVFCTNYIYTGTLMGVNESCILLEDAAVVYETGAFSGKVFDDAQKLPSPLYIQVYAIESFHETNKR